ncbi:MAG: hypothetical protein J3R72DRAFT_252054 [Linnemannia gamsii]|nr:MAG: hypothetical protein J3R72DRAFT_252054 [Linnemannia gamsii]
MQCTSVVLTMSFGFLPLNGHLLSVCQFSTNIGKKKKKRDRIREQRYLSLNDQNDILFFLSFVFLSLLFLHIYPMAIPFLLSGIAQCLFLFCCFFHLALYSTSRISFPCITIDFFLCSLALFCSQVVLCYACE